MTGMTVLSDYADRCRRLQRTIGVTERTYYPAVKDLLTACTDDHVGADIEISVVGGQPDVGLFAYKLPVLYVEVKCPRRASSNCWGCGRPVLTPSGSGAGSW